MRRILFKNKDVLVIGGGDSALQEGLFLTKYATQVRIVHRRDQLRAGEFLKKQAGENEKIKFVYDTVLEEIKGNGKVQEVLAKNVKTGKEGNVEDRWRVCLRWSLPEHRYFQRAVDDGRSKLFDHRQKYANVG